jgi:endoglucanase
MERITPNTLTSPHDVLYVGNLTEQVNYLTSKGAYAMIQPHNYGRFLGEIITDVSGFKTWWQNLAALYKDNPLVVFDTNNEFHDMPQSLVFDLNQAAIDGIRAAGATTQYITPEGNSWTGAWTWTSSGNGASLVDLKDPEDKLIYQMHQYLDSDGSGTSAVCVSSTIFAERLAAATQWLRENGKKGVIGEYAAGNNAQCIEALKGGLQLLQDNGDVWWGAIWWAAGPWYVFLLPLFILALALLFFSKALCGAFTDAYLGGATTFSTWSRVVPMPRGRRFCLRSRGILCRWIGSSVEIENWVKVSSFPGYM